MNSFVNMENLFITKRLTSLIKILLFILLTNCSFYADDQKNNISHESSHNNDQIEVSKDNLTSLRLIIKNSNKIDKTILDLTDNSDFYMINGKLVLSKDVNQKLEQGSTSCAVRKRNFTLINGVTYKLNTFTSGITADLYWSIAGSVSAGQAKALVILCTRLEKPVTVESMAQALNGLAEFKD